MPRVSILCLCLILLLCGIIGQAASPVEDRGPVVGYDTFGTFAEFGLSPEMLQELYKVGIDDTTIAKRLRALYPTRPERPATEQMVVMAVELDVSVVQLLQAYQMGNRVHRDPLWLLSLWKRTQSWEIVEEAFDRFTEASKMLNKEQSATEALVRHLASTYGISPGFVKEAVSIGIDAPTLLGILFYEDIYTLGRVVMPDVIGSQLPPDWRSGLPDITALNQFWPTRQFEGNLVQQIIKGGEATK